MSSKRGRKRNDNLPPNRARDVQRAFRARRAAHLQALEQRVSELEEENNCLRAALNLPPANRPTLGKGPTGKDKPKGGETDPSRAQLLSSRTSSSADSPSTTRTNSLSPSAPSTSMRTSPRNVEVLEATPWDQSLLMGDQHTESHIQAEVSTASTSTPYQLPPVNAPMPPKSIPQYSFPNRMYMPSQPHYSHTTDRPMASTYGHTNYLLRDIREEPEQPQHYSYSPAPYNPSHESSMQSHPQSNSLHPQTHHQHRDSTSAQSSLSYAHRRSITEPQGFRTIVNQFPHLPHPMPLPSHGIRLPSPPRLQDNGNAPHRQSGFTPGDGRLNPMS